MLRELILVFVATAICVLSLFFIIGLAVVTGVSPEKLSGPEFQLSVLALVYVLALMIVPILISYSFFKMFLNGTSSELGLRKRGLLYFTSGFFIGIFIQCANLALKYIINDQVLIHDVVPENANYFILWGYFLLAIVLLVLNSISEELVYRAVPLAIFSRYSIRPLYITAAASAIFSTIHFLTSESSLSSFVFRFLYGWLFCEVFLIIRSFWLLVGLHTGTNAIATLISGNWETGGVWSIDWSQESIWQEWSFSLVLFIAISLLYKFKSRVQKIDY